LAAATVLSASLVGWEAGRQRERFVVVMCVCVGVIACVPAAIFLALFLLIALLVEGGRGIGGGWM